MKILSKGFTLIEILIAISIIGILSAVVISNWRIQVLRGLDARRKADVAKFKRAFEEYYNDKGCYPPASIMDSSSDCNTSQLAPYLNLIPCDPGTRQPYLYLPLNNDPCQGYRVFASLQDKKDIDISRLNCDGPNACGFGENWNYGISAGAPVSQY